MKVLITGGTGVVGTGVIPAMLRAGHKVRVLSRHADEHAGEWPEGVESFAADISDADAVAAAIQECAAVLHVAGIVEEDPPDVTFERINLGGTRNVVAAAKKAGSPTLIYLSSLGAERGVSEYQQSKLRAEEIVRSYHGPWMIVRAGNVYGPGDETISVLLKMLRSLPAVPMVARGDQPFQPLWCHDLGAAMVALLERPEFAGRTLALAGPDVTTTEDVLRRLGEVTGRNVPRLAVPVWLTEVGVQMVEAFGGVGKRLLRSAGLEAPLNSAKLDMLLEENVIPAGTANALEELNVEPTSLDDGLDMLADMLPEQLPGDGVGAVRQTTYSAEIHDARFTAEELLTLVCDNIRDVMPIEFSAEPGAPSRAAVGRTLTAAIGGRGNVQVKLEERTPTRATFVTLEGHPIAGVMQLHVEPLDGAVRFNVHTAAQPANAVDWLAMRLVGDPVQRANWRAVVRRVVRLSGGHAPDGVQVASHPMDSTEAEDVRRFAEKIVRTRHREETAAVAESAAPAS